MHGLRADLKRTCAQPVTFRVLPETEPPGFDGGILYLIFYQNLACGGGVNAGHSVYHMGKVCRACGFCGGVHREYRESDVYGADRQVIYAYVPER